MIKAKDDNVMAGIRHSAHDMKENLNKVANQAGREVRGLLHSAGDEISHAGDAVTAEIRSNPVRSTAIALGVGVLLGALLRR